MFSEADRMSFLYFDCNYECGEKVPVYVGNQPKLSHKDPKKRRQQLFSWLGEQVWWALVEHHEAYCLEFHRRPDGRPGLTLIDGGLS